MADYRKQYKANTLNLYNTDESRVIRMQEREKSRKDQRTKVLAERRKLSDNANDKVNDVKDNRRIKLLRWKIEQNKRKEMEFLRKKPVFKVGIVRHKYYSPPVSSLSLKNIPQQTTKATSRQKGVTKATEKRLIAKAKNLQQSQKNISWTSENVETDKTDAVQSPKPKESFAPANYKFCAPVDLMKVPLFGRIAISQTPVKTPLNRRSIINKSVQKRASLNKISDSKAFNIQPSEQSSVKNKFHTEDSPTEISTIKESSHNAKENISNVACENTPPNETETAQCSNNASYTIDEGNLIEEPVFYSPYIVVSRGKSSARKEQQIRRGLSFSPNNIPTKENVMKNLNISMEAEECTAQYFKFILNKEIIRLNELCEKWKAIGLSEQDITEDAQYLINQAVGQTCLLINKKFERFRGLVSDCETGKGEMLVTCKDLQGFWDMMYMEIKDCDSRFEKLEKLRLRGWEEEPINIVKNVKKKIKQKKKVVPSKQSSIRAFILAAKNKRKSAHKQDSTRKSIDSQSVSEGNMISEKNVSRTSMKFDIKEIERSDDADYVCTPATKGNTNTGSFKKEKLLIDESRSSLSLVKSNRKYKTPEVRLDSTISYVNSDQIPNKSILKRLDDNLIIEASSKKLGQKVNFNDHVSLSTVPVEHSTELVVQNDLDLTARLNRIDSYNSDEDYFKSPIRAERRLSFDDPIFLKPENESCDIKSPSSLINDNRKDTTQVSSELNNFESTEILNKLEKCDVTNVSIKKSLSPINQDNVTKRILRKRVIVTNNLSTKRSSKHSVSNKNENNIRNKSPDKTEAEQSSNKKMVEISDKHDNTINTNEINKEANKRRKSTRKSVRFNAEDCMGCMEGKPVHPMTPHTRNSKIRSKISFLGEPEPCISLPTPGKDLISWDTPKKKPDRVKRSSCKNDT